MWNALIHICLSRITYATGRRFCKVILSSKFLNGNWHPCRFSNVSILNTINSFLTVNSLICYFHYFAPDKRVQILKCPIFFQLSSCSLHFSEKCFITAAEYQASAIKPLKNELENREVIVIQWDAKKWWGIQEEGQIFLVFLFLLLC